MASRFYNATSMVSMPMSCTDMGYGGSLTTNLYFDRSNSIFSSLPSGTSMPVTPEMSGPPRDPSPALTRVVASEPEKTPEIGDTINYDGGMSREVDEIDLIRLKCREVWNKVDE